MVCMVPHRVTRSRDPACDVEQRLPIQRTCSTTACGAALALAVSAVMHGSMWSACSPACCSCVPAACASASSACDRAWLRHLQAACAAHPDSVLQKSDREKPDSVVLRHFEGRGHVTPPPRQGGGPHSHPSHRSQARPPKRLRRSGTIYGSTDAQVPSVCMHACDAPR